MTASADYGMEQPPPTAPDTTRMPITQLLDAVYAEREWIDDAACAALPDEDKDMFFPPRGAPAGPAKAICNECPVRVQCLEYALDNHENFGIWGGKSDRERRHIRAQRARERAAEERAS